MHGRAAKSTIVSRRKGQRVVLKVTAAEMYEADTLESLGRDLRAAIEAAPDASHFILDLSQVVHLTSAALGLVINVHARLEAHGCRFAVAGAKGRVAQVFERSRMDEVIRLFPTVAAAGKGLCNC
jgi:anti-anti-sigma factor